MSNPWILLGVVAAALMGAALATTGYRYYTQLVAAEMAKHEKQGNH